MPGDLLERKLAKRFQLLDIDGDGYITRDDYEQLTQRLLDAYPERADGPIADRLRSGYLELWQQLARTADADGDGRVSPAEYRKAVASAGQGSGFERVTRPVAQSVLELADTDGDGTMSLTECARLLGAFGVAEEEAEQFFRRADTDGDGELTVEELLAAEREFLVTDDPDAPGNLLFGRI